MHAGGAHALAPWHRQDPNARDIRGRFLVFSFSFSQRLQNAPSTPVARPLRTCHTRDGRGTYPAA
jgi:hypothetical protein